MSAPAPQKPKKSSWLWKVVFFAIVFFIVAPMISSILNSLNEQVFPPVASSSRYVPPPRPTYATSGSTAGRYTPSTPDTRPDDPPFPSTYAEIDQMLEDNPLYAQNLIPTQCTIAQIDLVNAPVAQVEDHMNRFVDCLMDAWYPPVANAGFELPHPSVTVYSTVINTACGQLPMYNAIYCSADQQIYYAQNLIEAFPSSVQTMRLLAESVIAHEFGHAVQYRTMILMSEAILEDDAVSDEDEMDLSRRLEMQADCFSGLFFNSIWQSAGLTTTDENNLATLFTWLGGTTPYSDDHGTGANRANWAAQGLDSTTPGTCDTFTAPADQVS